MKHAKSRCYVTWQINPISSAVTALIKQPLKIKTNATKKTAQISFISTIIILQKKKHFTHLTYLVLLSELEKLSHPENHDFNLNYTNFK